MPRYSVALVRATLTACVAVSFPQGGAAQDGSLNSMLGTLDVEAKSHFADGQLNGCLVEFNLMARDWLYKQGAYITVGGLFGVMSTQGNLATVLKVVLHDLDPRTMSPTPSQPASAYFVSGNSTSKNAVVETYRSDTPGGIFVVFKMDPTFSVIAEGVSKGTGVRIAFAREDASTDIRVLIDTSVVKTEANGQRTRSPQPKTDFLDCTQTLLRQTVDAK